MVVSSFGPAAGLRRLGEESVVSDLLVSLSFLAGVVGSGVHGVLACLSLEADLSLALMAGVTLSWCGVRERSGWTRQLDPLRLDFLTGVGTGAAASSDLAGPTSMFRVNWKFFGAKDLGHSPL